MHRAQSSGPTQSALSVGNVTLATLHTHPFYRDNSAEWAAVFGMHLDPWQQQAPRQYMRQYKRGKGQPFTGGPFMEGEHGAQEYDRTDSGSSQCHAAAFAQKVREGPAGADGSRTDCRGGTPGDWGLISSGKTALLARVCVNHAYAGPGKLASLCHTLDRWADHHCAADGDCGVDAVLCRQRTCSGHGFCKVPLLLKPPKRSVA